MAKESLLSVQDLRIHFRTAHGTLKAVQNASFEIDKGEIYGIVGESGSGKSVTALSILRILPSNAVVADGKIMFKDRDILSLNDREIRALRGKEISMVFQDPQASFDPLFTISNQIEEMVRIHRKIDSKELERRVVHLIRNVGIPEPQIRKDQYPHQFSGGMKQRAMSAMALANSPDLIIADEPTTSLDVTIQAQIMELFKELANRMNVAILLITHDMGLIAETCDRVSVMYAGRILETADVFSLFQNPQHPYTRGLIRSIPRIDDDMDELSSIPGRVPDPMESFPGCVFQPRCPYAEDICRQGVPELLTVADGIQSACFRVQKGEI